MKRALVILALLTLGLLACSQTGTGWYPERRKVNFRDSTSFAKSVNFLVPYRIGGTAVTSSAAELNILDGALVNYVELNRLVGVTSSVQTQLNAKQETLVSGTNIRTVNGTSLLGSGNIVIEGGEGGSMVYPGAGIPISTGTAWGTSITNNSVQWDTAFVARNRWDGGAIGLTAATGRTSLGGTTVGQNLFTLTNPDAIRFLRINADNTVTALSAANFKTALSLTSSDVGLGNVTNESKTTMFTSPTFTTSVNLAATTYVPSGGTINFNTSGGYMSYNATDDDLYIGNMGVQLLTGTLGKELAPVSKGWFTDLDVNNTITGSISGNAATVTGFTRNSGTITLTGGHGITFTTTGITSVTLPTSGTLATTTQLANDTTTLHNYFEARVDSIVGVLSDTTDIETLLQIDLDTDTIPSMDWVREYVADHGGGLPSDTVPLGDVAPLLADVEPIYVFGLGSGQIADTAAFNNGAFAGAFYYNGQHTLKITSLRGALMSGTGTETIGVQVAWSDTLNAVVPTKLNTIDLTITSMTVGTSDTSFDNDEIEPGNWVWCELSGASAGNKPSMLVLTMSGYKIAN